MVLLLTVYQASALLELRDDVKAAVGRLLDASILFSRLELSRTIEDAHRQRWSRPGGYRLIIPDNAAVASIDLNKSLLVEFMGGIVQILSAGTGARYKIPFPPSELEEWCRFIL